MHSCSALLVSCIDFRIQPAVEDWARRNLGDRNYDRAAVAGGVKDFPAVRHAASTYIFSKIT